MKEGIKTFINNTGKDISVTMFIRDGGSPNETWAEPGWPSSQRAASRRRSTTRIPARPATLS